MIVRGSREFIKELSARLNGKQIGQPKGSKLTTKKSLAAKEIIKKHSKDMIRNCNAPLHFFRGHIICCF